MKQMKKLLMIMISSIMMISCKEKETSELSNSNLQFIENYVKENIHKDNQIKNILPITYKEKEFDFISVQVSYLTKDNSKEFLWVFFIQKNNQIKNIPNSIGRDYNNAISVLKDIDINELSTDLMTNNIKYFNNQKFELSNGKIFKNNFYIDGLNLTNEEFNDMVRTTIDNYKNSVDYINKI